MRVRLNGAVWVGCCVLMLGVAGGARALAQAGGADSGASAQTKAAESQGAAATGTSPVGLPTVPTTKVLAIGHRSATATPEALRSVLPTEVRKTVKLYLGGKIDQWYSRGDGQGVVFVMNVTTVEEARSLLEALPLGQRKLLEFEYIPLGPLNPLALLVREK